MQGYEMPLVVKEIFLPVEYDTFTALNQTFGDFAKAYKEKYGIDLHDIFGLVINSGVYSIKFRSLMKIFLVGVAPGVAYDSLTIPMIPLEMNAFAQSDSKHPLLSVNVGFGNNYGYGFNLVLPVEGTQVSTIDDLTIEGFEF